MDLNRRADTSEIRAFHAKLMAAASKSIDPRLERVFELVPREAFLPPGPWKVMVDNRYFETPSDDPAYVYQNALIALDPIKGINNGEPFLHAAWIGAATPKSGETVCHIGTGMGYYTAILSALVVPGGRVEAFEVDAVLAEKTRNNLQAFEGVNVTHGDATNLPLPSCDLIYVNAGVKVLPQSWLSALRPQGRLIFPWRPAESVGVAVLITRTDHGFTARPLMPSWFIPCVGGNGALDDAIKDPGLDDAWAIQSVWLTSDRAPDESCVAEYRHLWFSSSTLQ